MSQLQRYNSSRSSRLSVAFRAWKASLRMSKYALLHHPFTVGYVYLLQFLLFVSLGALSSWLLGVSGLAVVLTLYALVQLSVLVQAYRNPMASLETLQAQRAAIQKLDAMHAL